MAIVAFEPKLPPPLDQLRQIKSQFLASLNHELRTPLSGIVGMVDLLLETQLGDQQREYAAAARECAAELLGQLNAALEFSDLSAGSFVLDELEFNLAETLSAAAQRHERKAREKGLLLAAALDAALPQAAVGDAVRLSAVVSHLVGHAVQSARQGAIEMRANAGPCRPGTFRLNVSVRDIGDERPPDPRNPSLNLELAVATRVVVAMGGEIKLEPELGNGNVASFWVPLRESAGTSRPEHSSTPAPRRVLAVEDDLIAQRIISHHLARLGYHARVVSGGDAALMEAARDRYDVVLMDLQMPSMDGLETARRIHELPGRESLPVIALTARAGGESRLSCAGQGIQGFLEKPIDAARLGKVIEQTLDRISHAASSRDV